MKHSYLTAMRLCSVLTTAVLLFVATALKAEGIRQVAPNPDDKVMLLIGNPTYGNFAQENGPETGRLYVRINNPSEVLYIGLSGEYNEDGTPQSTGSYSFQIKRVGDNSIVHGPFTMSAFLQNLSNWNDASGPAALNGGIGYNTDDDRFTFAPGEAGLYYIEFRNAEYIGLWDFTVGLNNQTMPGRVYSKNWAFRTPTVANETPECVWDRQFNGTLYSYTADGFVTRINFNESGFQGLSFSVAFNTKGPGQSGDLALDRMSVAEQNLTANVAEHFIFLSAPDPMVFPDGNCGNIIVSPYFSCAGDGTYCLPVSVTQPGQVEVVLDFNRNGVFDAQTDRRILHVFNQGAPLNHCLFWDGLMADGSPVDPGSSVNLLVQYSQGVQHWALFDGEFLKEGFCVEPVRPLCSVGNETDVLYWDDRNIPEDPGTGQPKDGRQGCFCEDEGCRTWNFFDPGTTNCNNINDANTTGYGDRNTLNTWWFANVVTVTRVDVPLITLDITGVDTICEGGSAVLEFDYTSSGVITNITWQGPQGLIATGSNAPRIIQVNQPGLYSLTVEEGSGCSITTTHTIVAETCEADVELDISASTTTPNIGQAVTFTITVTNQGSGTATGVDILSDWAQGLANITAISGGGVLQGNGILWNDLTLAVGQTITLTFVGVVTPAFDYTIEAEVVAANAPDPDSTPNNGTDTDGDGNCADDAGDEDDGDCVHLNPPSCSINAVVSNILCNDNDTPSDGSDDTYTFTLRVTGTQGSTGWTATDNQGATVSGSYGQTIPMGPYPIAGGNQMLSVADNFFGASCSTTATANAPLPCSDDCAISVEVGQITCQNNGTPSVGSDDTYSFTFRVVGVNTGASWVASDGTSGPYNTWRTYGPYPISGGDRTLTFTDIADPGCSTTRTFEAPPPCSNLCLITASVGPVVCNNNGTPSFPGDDTFTFTINVTGDNTGGSWTANDPLNSTGAYSTTIPMGPYLIANGPLTFTIRDAQTTSCRVNILVNPPPSCSNECGITVDQRNVVCNDNGTPSIADDDYFTLEVNVTGANASSGWRNQLGQTGIYGQWVPMGPFPIANGNVEMTFTDALNFNCRTTETFVAPPTCSNTCVIQAEVLNVLCNNAGTPSDPSDDTFTFDLLVDGLNTSAGWTVQQPFNASGTYGNLVPMGPFPIAEGGFVLQISDSANPNCTTTATVVAPTTCSNLCDITTVTLGTAICNDAGTNYDSSDDTFTVSVVVAGLNTSSAGWRASNGQTGAYNTPVVLGPFAIGDGMPFTLSITDQGDAACTSQVTLTPPPTCSEQCFIEAVTIANITCNHAGTPSDDSDDTFTFEMRVNGFNVGGEWVANDPLLSNGGYNQTILMGPYLISEGGFIFTINDQLNPACNTVVTVEPPATCSDECLIAVETSDVVCFDNNTPHDPSDDTYTFTLLVTGFNTGGFWEATNGMTGLYNVPETVGPLPISGGAYSTIITDSEDNTCSTQVTVQAPSTCSEQCLLVPEVGVPICHDAGTPTDPSDDTFTFTLQVTGFNTGATWTLADGSLGAAYGSVVTMGPYPISGGQVCLDLRDELAADCTASVCAEAPATCSDQCAITAEAINVICNDAGTPTIPGDDTFTFELLVSSINNTGDNWILANGTIGAYNQPRLMGPYAIASGAVNLLISDIVDGNCQFNLDVTPPMHCSTDCELIVEVLNTDCFDMGTISGNDDEFTYTLLVTGINTVGTWTASDGTSGQMGVPATSTRRLYEDGSFAISIINESGTCAVTQVILPPKPTMFCPPDTDQRAFQGNIQILRGRLDENDVNLEEPPCILALGSNPMTIGDRNMQPIDFDTPFDEDTTAGVYTFFLFTDIPLANEISSIGAADGAGAIFRGDYMGYADPCCFNVSYADEPGDEDENQMTDPMIDTTGFFNREMYLVERFTHNLKMGQQYSLIATTYGAGAVGNFAWVVVSTINDSLEVHSNDVSSEFLEDQMVSYDLTYLNIGWAMNNPNSTDFLGQPEILPQCGVDSLYFLDRLDFDDDCNTAYLQRNFYMDINGQLDSCLQEIAFRRPVYQDIVLPPATVTFNCGDEYEVTIEGYPAPVSTGYPILNVGQDYVEMIENTPYYNLAISYKDTPVADTSGLLLNLTRTWSIRDLCTGDTVSVFPQAIKIGDLNDPYLDCPLSNHYCPIVEEDIMLFPTDPFLCTATIDVPNSQLRGFCDDSRAALWSLASEIIDVETGDIIANFAQGDSRVLTNLERGDYWIHFMGTDNLTGRVESYCRFRVGDLQPPQALCEGVRTVYLEPDNALNVQATALDRGSSDNCPDLELTVRRFYPAGNDQCDLSTGSFGEWASSVDFHCCDVGLSFPVELRVMDIDSNYNYCTVTIQVRDTISPAISGLEAVQWSCNDLPAYFEADSLSQIQAVFGMPNYADNCGGTLEEMAPVLTYNNCALSTIRRQFALRHPNALVDNQTFEQLIEIIPDGAYNIAFPADVATDCPASLEPLQINGWGCSDFVVNYTDEIIQHEDVAGCYRIARTYEVVNTCTWDGVSEAIELDRDEDCNGNAGDETLWLVVQNGNVWLDADATPNNNFPAAGASTCGNNPQGYWRSLGNVARWRYTQFIDVQDLTAPTVRFEAPAPVVTTSTACEALVNVPFIVSDGCSGQQPLVRVWLDAGADNTLDEEITGSALTIQNQGYLIRGNFEIGLHAFRILALDLCGNQAEATIPFSVQDGFIEQPICPSGITVYLTAVSPAIDVDDDGITDEAAAILSGSSLLQGLMNDCSGPYNIAINELNAAIDFYQHTAYATCEDRYTHTFRVILADQANNPYSRQPDGSMGGPNYLTCQVQIAVRDTADICTSCAEQDLEVDGAILSRNAQPIADVEVRIAVNNTPWRTLMTETDGVFKFEELAFSQNYEVRPYKNDDTSNGVTPLDLIILQRHLTFDRVITDPYLLLAADVNRSGTVTTADLLIMQEIILGRLATFPNNTSWRFLASDYVLTDIADEFIRESYFYSTLNTCQFGQDFIGIKIGDLNGSARPGSGDMASSEVQFRSNTRLLVPDVQLREGEVVEIPFLLEDAASLSGVFAQLQSVPGALTLLEVREGLCSKAAINAQGFAQTGTLRSLYLAAEGQKGSTLFKLLVKANTNGKLSDVLTLDTQSAGYTQALESSALELVFTNAGQNLLLSGNHPDPFGQTTAIDLVLPHAGEYTFSVFSVDGRRVFTQIKDAAAGQHTLRIDGSQWPSGMYYYQLSFEGQSITKKMVKL